MGIVEGLFLSVIVVGTLVLSSWTYYLARTEETVFEKRRFLFATSAISIVAIVWLTFLFTREDTVKTNRACGRSPEQIYPVYDGPGTGHGFGYNIAYTVEHHVMLDGKEMAVVSSGADGEGDVEIWSSIPDLVALPDGGRFKLSEANGKGWNKAFKVLK